MGLGKALLDVSDGRGVLLGDFFALALVVALALRRRRRRLLLLELLQLLVVANAREVENLKGSGKVVVFFLVLVSFFLGLFCFKKKTMGN